MADGGEIRVRVTGDELAEIRDATKQSGLRYPAEFMRMVVLREARLVASK